MQDIPIYKAERSVAGLEEQIKAQSSVAYVSPLEPANDMQPELVKAIANLDMSSAIAQALQSRGSQNDSDLYFTKSIFVTTTWNKNTDIFTPAHTWAARHTPTHKPTNLEHDETKLVGHIVDCWPMDTEGTLIQDNCTIDELPAKFHLVNGAVIYKNWESEELVERTMALIQAIEERKKFVSMEVLFTDFDYGILKPDGSYHTKARNEETAWMTQHLRQYGGTGECEGYKIGRVLKNMTFSGKGYVDKPANPESVIFSAHDNNFSFTSASATKEKLSISDNNGVFNDIEEEESSLIHNIGDSQMSEQIYKEQAAELKVTVAELENKLADVNDKLAKADVEKYTSEIAELTTKVEDLEKKNADLETSLAAKTTEATEAVEALETEKTAKADLETKLAEITAAEAKANRVSTLVDGGIDKEVATEKVETFANLSDEQFTAIADELISAAKAQAQIKTEASTEETEEETEEQADEETDEAEANADDKVLENAEAEEETELNVGSTDEEVDEMEETRKELQAAIAAHLGHEINDDNEGDK